MFKIFANVAFNNGMFSCAIIQAMHEQMTRLYDAARILRQTTGPSSVAALLNISPQNVYAWEKRGISNEGLLRAQEVIGCDAIWLRDGVGDIMRSKGTDLPVLSDVAQLIILYEQSTKEGKKQILRMAQNAEKLVSSRNSQQVRNKR